MDWEKAFDKISHEWLFLALKSMNIPIELMRIIEGLYKKPRFFVEIEGIKSSIGKQETGIRQGCPLSPYLFILVMDRIFEIIPYIAKEHWDEIKMELPPHMRGSVPGMLKTFKALLYADDTLLCEEHVEKMEALLWAVEDVSGTFGLKLNKKKCVQLSILETRPIRFKNGDHMKIAESAEYLGSLFNDEANPRMEIKSRLNKAARCRFRLKEFWNKAKLNRLEKILIYEALIGAKLTYALEVLPIPESEFDKLDAEYLRGFRQIFGLETTHGHRQDGEEMTNTNEKIIELVSEALKQTKKQRRFCPISKVIKARTQKRFGDVLRRPWTDPMAQVTRGIHRTRATPWNFPPQGTLLPWRPKVNWIVETSKRAWEQYRIYERLPHPRYGPRDARPKGKNIGDTKVFNWKHITHVRALLKEADSHTF